MVRDRQARLGLLPTNALLVYGTGGFAYGHVHDDAGLDINNSFGVPGVVIGGFGFACTTPVSCFAGSSSRTATGWTAGGGFEYALSQNVSFKTEYLYSIWVTVLASMPWLKVEQERFRLHSPSPITGWILMSCALA